VVDGAADEPRLDGVRGGGDDNVGAGVALLYASLERPRETDESNELDGLEMLFDEDPKPDELCGM